MTRGLLILLLVLALVLGMGVTWLAFPQRVIVDDGADGTGIEY